MTKIIAHRGSKGNYPENTLAAFKEAIRVGVQGIELDVQQTKDQQLVVIHDETLERTTNGHGEVRHFTLAELKKLDAGSWFEKNPIAQELPTLLEVLSLLEQEKFCGLLNIEIKTDNIHYEGIERRLVQLMQSKEWSFEYMYSSFYLPSLININKLEKNSKLAYIFEQSEKVVAPLQIEILEGIHPKVDWFFANHEKIKSGIKKIRPWRVNTTTSIERCFAAKVAGIHTDFPEKALKIQALIKDRG